MTAILIIGEPGSGKSTAIKTLDSKSTFIINVLKKEAFKGWKLLYKKLDADGNGNFIVTTDYKRVVNTIKYVSKQRPEIKTLIVDDWQYLLSFEFMARLNDENSYDKFTEIAAHGLATIQESNSVRDDLNVFYLSHSDIDANGKIRCKTIGKLLNEKISIEGLFSIVFYAFVREGKFVFQTQSNENTIAKSPMEMFEDLYISNDMQFIVDKINDYFGEI